jgi:ABC-type polysaccharide/polyol phosphate export permease
MALKNMKVSVIDTVLGKLWYLIEPLSHMLIYYFIIVVIFNAGARYGINPFVFLMMGLSHYLLLSSTVNLGSGSILSSQGILLQLNIEPLVFVWIAYYKSCINFAITFCIYLVFYLSYIPRIPPNIVYYPFLLFILFLLAYSLSVIAATLVIMMRDIRPMVSIMLRVLMYMSPVIYSIEFIPQHFREVYLYNPLACLFALFHWSVFDAPLPSGGPILSLLVFSSVVFVLSHMLYNKLKIKFTKMF